MAVALVRDTLGMWAWAAAGVVMGAVGVVGVVSVRLGGTCCMGAGGDVTVGVSGGVEVGCGVGAVFWDGDVMVAKMSASCWSAARWTRAAGGRGSASDGLRRAATRSWAAAAARSREEVVGMSTWDGNHVNVFAMRSARVASAQMV